MQGVRTRKCAPSRCPRGHGRLCCIQNLRATVGRAIVVDSEADWRTETGTAYNRNRKCGPASEALGMRLIYTKHAQARMTERGITEAEVEAAVQSPDVQYPDGRGNMNCVKRTVRVVLKGDGRTVITVVRRDAT